MGYVYCLHIYERAAYTATLLEAVCTAMYPPLDRGRACRAGAWAVTGRCDLLCIALTSHLAKCWHPQKDRGLKAVLRCWRHHMIFCRHRHIHLEQFKILTMGHQSARL